MDVECGDFVFRVGGCAAVSVVGEFLMPRLRLTLDDGAKVFVDKVEAVEVERVCPYGDHPFFTSSLTRVYCSASHSELYRRKTPPELREAHNLSLLTA